MSAFYDLASLVLVPSGYKASKVYAQKPLTTDGQLTFSRASTATRVNSAGLIETVSSNVPRLDYLGSTCPKLLLEPQRSNLCLYSEQFDNAPWALYNGTQVANTTETLDPSGYYGAEKVIMGVGNTATYRQSIGGLTNGATYTFSLYIKQGSGVTAFLDICDASGTPDITPTSEWVRYTKTGVWNTTLNFVDIELRGTSGSAYCYIWGAQLELGAYATSYIPTTSAAVTRLADACSKTGISSLIGQTEGTLFAVIKSQQAGSTYNWLNLTDGTTNNWVFIGKDGTKWRNYVRASGAVIFDNSATTISDNTDTKIALAYKSGQIALYINGTQIATSSTTFTFGASLSQFIIGTIGAAVGERSLYSQTLLFKTRLTNAQLSELTTL